MLCCMRAFLEYGINLREGYDQREVRGEPAPNPIGAPLSHRSVCRALHEP